MTGPRRRPLGLLLAAVAVAVGVAAWATAGGDESSSSSTTTTAAPEATSTTAAPATTQPPAPAPAPAVAWPALSTAGPGAVVTPSGVVLAVIRPTADGRFVATSPCGNEVTVAGNRIGAATVVLDPGHGGGEPGAVGPGGTQEKAVNQAVAEAAKQKLETLGATVVLTRTGDYRITLASRAAIVMALRPMLFVSIHHNADPDGPRPAGPGSETYFQIGSDPSRRAAGLLYEEVTRALAAFPAAWVADTDAGAKYRPAADGGDYYGILRRTAGVPAVLSEAAFVSNPSEEQLLNDPRVQQAEADAIVAAAVRFATTADPGSGFVEPYPRTAPAGGGGGPQGCVDPPLG